MENTKEIVNIGIWTPYLFENMAEKYDEDYIQKQIQMFGYDPNSLITEDKVITERNIVLLDKEERSLIKRPHLVIAGCTASYEELVGKFKGTGLLVARYSTFYGEPSDYTGNYPDYSGYAFDIPKKPDIVKALLRHDDFLEGIVARDEIKIRIAVDRLNATVEKPVLITDYLHEALECR